MAVNVVGPILVVDDNVETTVALVAVLQLRGYETVTAHDGLHALALLRAGLRPSLIVLDWMMPNLDGRGFLDEVATDDQLKSIPVVIYSVLDYRIMVDGVAATLSKTSDPDILLDVVARFARRDEGHHRS
jgi:CheY-like chemotaxis protein